MGAAARDAEDLRMAFGSVGGRMAVFAAADGPLGIRDMALAVEALLEADGPRAMDGAAAMLWTVDPTENSSLKAEDCGCFEGALLESAVDVSMLEEAASDLFDDDVSADFARAAACRFFSLAFSRLSFTVSFFFPPGLSSEGAVEVVAAFVS